MTKPFKIVIAGGGFAGVRAARRLGRVPGLDVTIVTPNDEFAYYPQLYHAATGGVRSEASIPLAELLAGTDVTVIRDSLTVLDAERRVVHGASGTKYAYDKLVLALGVVTNYFGIPGLEDNTFNIKTIDGATDFKLHLHEQLTRGHKPELNYVIVGGGPTGIELSAALSEYLERITALHGIGAPKYTITLVEANARLLPRSVESHAARITARLEQLGVKIMTGAKVEAASTQGLTVNGKLIKSGTVVWTAGVTTNPFFRNNADDFTLAKNGRVEVNQYMEARPDVYVIGDNAASPYGGLAEIAVGDANFVADDILRRRRDTKLVPYVQRMPTSVIPVGTGWAAVEHGNIRLYGYPGWILRRLGDLIAYHDMEPTVSAVKVWLRDGRRQDDCEICTPASA